MLFPYFSFLGFRVMQRFADVAHDRPDILILQQVAVGLHEIELLHLTGVDAAEFDDPEEKPVAEARHLFSQVIVHRRRLNVADERLGRVLILTGRAPFRGHCCRGTGSRRP